MNPPVQLDAVSFTYPDAERPALRDVTLTVEEGTFTLLVGHTGSGKSTLLRAMNGLVPHFTGGRFRGRVLVAGRSTLDHPPRRLADVVAFVPQDPGASFVVDRVEDELAYAMENLAVPPDTMRRRVEEALDLLDLATLRARSVRALSGGERQRVAIAAALTAGPRILLLDEPTSQLDPQGAEDVLAALQRLVHDHGMTVIAAEHRLERAASYADAAIGCCGDGRVVSGATRAVLDAVGVGPPVAALGRVMAWEPLPLNVRDARAAARAAPVVLEPLPRPPLRRAQPLLRLARVRSGYGGVPVLKDVSLEIRAGEIVALIGRNGAGKTTLLRTIAGVHPVTAGEVRTAAGRPPRAGSDVALCPQDPDAVLFRDTVEQEIATTIRAVGAAGTPSDVLADVAMTDLAERHPRDLSAGERLLVAIAAMVATGAPLLLLDEPTRGLDASCKTTLIDLLRSRAARGGAALIATHDVELVADVAARVVMLAEGDVIADGDPHDVIGDSSVFAPQTARVFGKDWLTPAEVARARAGTDVR